MDNAEEIQLVLERYSRLKPKEIPDELEEYLTFVAKTGDTVFKWPLIQYLFREKLLSVITEFHNTTPSITDIPHYPNVDPFNYELMKKMLIERMEAFHSAPFTIQRICELLTEPRKQYSRIDKFMRAIEKNILVVSTLEPGRRRHESENGESIDSYGDLLSEGHVDVGGGDDHNHVPVEAGIETNLDTELNKDDESGMNADLNDEIEVPLEKLEPEVNVLTVDPLCTEENETKLPEEMIDNEVQQPELVDQLPTDEVKTVTDIVSVEITPITEDTRLEKTIENDIAVDSSTSEVAFIVNTGEEIVENIPTKEITFEHNEEVDTPHAEEDPPKATETTLNDLPTTETVEQQQQSKELKESEEVSSIPQDVPESKTEPEIVVSEEPKEIVATNLINIELAAPPVEATEEIPPIDVSVVPAPISTNEPEQTFIDEELSHRNVADVVDMETDPQPVDDSNQKVIDSIPFAASAPEFLPQEQGQPITNADVVDMETDQQHVEDTSQTVASGTEEIFGKQEQGQEVTSDVVDMETAETQANNVESKNEMMQVFL